MEQLESVMEIEEDEYQVQVHNISSCALRSQDTTTVGTHTINTQRLVPSCVFCVPFFPFNTAAERQQQKLRTG